MYFEVANTPEHRKRNDAYSNDEVYFLTLVPFSPMPTIVFEDVLVGNLTHKILNISNPKAAVAQISVKKKADDVNLDLSWSECTVRPHETVQLRISWNPNVPVAQRTSVQIVDARKGKYDVVIVCKSNKINDKKTNKKKSDKLKVKKSLFKTVRSKPKSPKYFAKKYLDSSKENNRLVQALNDNVTIFLSEKKSPVTQNISINNYFETKSFSENHDIRRDTYLISTNTIITNERTPVKKKILGNRNGNVSVLSAIENLEFTPLRVIKNVSKFENKQQSTENDATHPIINLVNSSDSSIEFKENSFTNDDYFTKKCLFPETSLENVISQTPRRSNLPKLNSSIIFEPDRCSTEKKMIFPESPKIIIDVSPDNTFTNLGSATYTKEDSPIVPLDPESNQYLQSSPYSPVVNLKNQYVTDNMKNYNERLSLRNTNREKNNFGGNIKSVIEANMWLASPPTRVQPISPTPLSSIPEESSIICTETTYNISKRAHETFVLNQTYENNTVFAKPAAKPHWSKSKVKKQHDFTNFSLDVYSMATIVDPFMASTCLYDEAAFEKLEVEFKRWLNYLLTPPSDLDTKVDVDIGKAWIENRSKLVPAAPTNEQMSLSYHTSHRLQSLRRAGNRLISTMTQVFLKVSCQVEKKILSIRVDRNLHLDIGLQKTILRLLLCYNPLWLRIGLEVLFGKMIPLSSNSDISGLSEFIIEHIFKNMPGLSKNLLLQPSNIETLKKFTLKKLLFLVYFLDRAKEQKIIFHDPCLFCRNAEFKESKQILYQIAKELLSGVGDIAKHLRPTGYVVSHKQTYLNEYKYAVHNLAVDLKDGVRLTRLMEIILVRDGLLANLRTPAISRLQKVHNVQVALTALASANFSIVGDITAKDIADGHREKTLSLLWQLINKFRAPLFENSAIVIQKWWRRKYLEVWLRNKIVSRKMNNAATVIQSRWRGVVGRRLACKKRMETKASIIIQKNWRMWKHRSSYEEYRQTAIIIQKQYRSKLCIKRAKLLLDSLRKNRAAKIIQNWYRRSKVLQEFKQKNIERFLFLQKRISALVIQRWYRNILLRRYLKSQNTDRPAFLLKRKSATTIQFWFRKMKLNQYLKSMNADRPKFLLQKSSAISIQKWYKRKKLYEYLKSQNYDRPLFLQKKSSAILIQRWYRRIVLNLYLRSVNIDRPLYLKKRESIITIQKWYRHQKLCEYLKSQNVDRPAFLKMRQAAITIQIWYRRIILLRYLESQNTDRPMFLAKRESAVIIQRWYRRVKLTEYLQSQNVDRPIFLKKRESAVTIQNWYRSILLRRYLKSQNTDRPVFLLKRKSAITIQIWFRKIKLNQYLKSINTDRPKFLLQKSSAISIQKWYRRIKLYEYLKSQNHDRPLFLQKKSAAILIQRWYRRIVFNLYLRSVNKDRPLYLKKRESIITIQKWYRHKKLCEYLKSQNVDRPAFVKMRESAITIQTWYRRIILLRYLETQNTDRPMFLAKRESAVIIQRWYRRVKLTEYLQTQNVDRPMFLKKRESTVMIQNWYRSILLRRYLESQNMDRPTFLLKRKSAVTIQIWFRKMKLNQYLKSINADRPKFLLQKSSAISIQKWYRRKKLYEYLKAQNHDRPLFLQKKSAAILIQRWYRRIVLNQYLQSMNVDRPLYLKKRESIITIQKWYRHKKLCEYLKSQNVDRPAFLLMRESAITIQTCYRRIILLRYMESQNTDRPMFLTKRESAVIIQRWYRRIKLTEYLQSQNLDRPKFLLYRQSAILIQRWYRYSMVLREMKENNKDRPLFLQKRSSAMIIQKWYRNKKLSMQNIDRTHFLQVKTSTIVIQKWFRNLTNNDRKTYLRMKFAAKTIQAHYRNYLVCRRVRNDFLQLRNVTIAMQRSYRRKKLAQAMRENYLKKLNSAKIIQRHYRAWLAMKCQRRNYEEWKRAVVVLQQRYKAYVLMKRCRKRFLLLRNICMKIQYSYREQASIRRSIAKHQKALEELKTKEDLEKKRIRELQNRAALKIQSYWRGYNLRKKQMDDCKVKILRKKWQMGGLVSNQLTLAERNYDALDVISCYRDIASLIRAFKTLEFITNVYPMIYNKEQVNNVSRNLIIYMGATNRSVCTLETLQLAISILINLTRYRPTAHHAFKTAYLDTLLMLMMRWCDKDLQLSCALCTLLWLYGKYEDIYEDVCQYLKLDDPYKILCKVRSSILRKKRMDTHKRNSFATPVKNKASHVIFPMLEPNFGIANCTKAKAFVNDIDGIDSIFNKYNLPLNVFASNNDKSPSSTRSVKYYDRNKLIMTIPKFDK